jgi:hypothetical protein
LLIVLSFAYSRGRTFDSTFTRLPTYPKE